MSSPTENDEVGAAAAASTFRDEIFEWPISSLNSDVWSIIFRDYITHPADQQNLIVASPQYFRPLLAERVCANLFGNVVHQLQKHRYLTLSNEQFLSYRRLSKACKMSIDTVLQKSIPCFLHINGIDHDTQDPHHKCWSYKTEEQLVQIVEKYKMIAEPEGRARNSVGLIPSLQIELPDLNISQNLQSTLSSVGFQISYLSIKLSFQPKIWIESYQLLSSLLGLMPNLMSLKLVGFGSRYETFEGGDQTLCRYTVANPLPILQRLVFLDVATLRHEIQSAIITMYAEQLEKLCASSPSSGLHFNSVFSASTKLAELSIALHPCTHRIIVEILDENIKWPTTLRSFGFRVHLLPGGLGNKEFEQLCAALFKKSESHHSRLNALNLNIYHGFKRRKICPINIASYFRFQLPSLRYLWVHTEYCYFNRIDFILGLRDSLEELVLIMHNSNRKREQSVELIWFLGYWHRMYESNIWEVMPHLRRLIIRTLSRSPYYPRGNKCFEYVRPAQVSTDISQELGALFLTSTI